MQVGGCIGVESETAPTQVYVVFLVKWYLLNPLPNYGNQVFSYMTVKQVLT